MRIDRKTGLPDDPLICPDSPELIPIRKRELLSNHQLYSIGHT